MIVDGIQVQLPQVDTSLSVKLGFKKKTVSAATRIHEFVNQKDDKELLYLARNDLQNDIRKWERKTAAKQSQASVSSQDSKDTTNANNCPPKKQQREKFAKVYYEERHKESDVAVVIKNKLLTDPKRQITGRVSYQLQKYGAPVGFLHIEIVCSKDFKDHLDESNKVYHRIQTLLYAGQMDDFNYCDYVCFGETEMERTYERVTADKEWQSTVAQRAHKYCDYYDQLWELTKQQYYR